MKPNEWLETRGFTPNFPTQGVWCHQVDGIQIQQTQDGNFYACLSIEGRGFAVTGTTPKHALRSLLRDVEGVAISFSRWRETIGTWRLLLGSSLDTAPRVKPPPQPCYQTRYFVYLQPPQNPSDYIEEWSGHYEADNAEDAVRQWAEDVYKWDW